MFRRLGRKAQTTAEYAILIALVVGAVVAMQVYVKRGIQGRVRDAVDHTGTIGDVGNTSFNFSGGQYEPYYLVSDSGSNQTASNTENLLSAGGINRTGETTSTGARNQTMEWDGYTP